MAEAEVKTSSAYLLFYQRKGVMENVREDLETGFHWIYKLYPNAYKSVAQHLNRNVNNSHQTESIMDQDIPHHLNSPDHSPLIKDPPNRVQTSPAKTRGSPLQRSDSEPSVYRNEIKHSKTNSDLAATDFVPDKAWRQIEEDSDVLVKPSQLKNAQKRMEGHETILTAKGDINNWKPYDHNKYTDKRKELPSPVKQPLPGKIEEKKHSTAGGLTVKLPEKEVFIVRQNHKTGQTTYEPFSKHTYPEEQSKQRGSFGPQSNGSSTSKQDLQEKRLSAPQRGVPDHQDDVDVPPGLRSFPPSFSSRMVSARDGMWSSPDQPPSPIDYNRQLSNPTKSAYVDREPPKNTQVKRSKSQARSQEHEQNTINELKNQGKQSTFDAKACLYWCKSKLLT